MRILEEDQPVEEEVVEEAPVSDEEQVTDEEEQPIEDSPEPQMYDIGGTQYSQEQVEAAFKDSQNKEEWSRSNTQRAQDLAAEAKGLERSKYLEDLMTQNPGLGSQLENTISGFFNGRGQDGEEISDDQRALREVQGLKQQMAQNKQYSILEREISELKTQYPDDFKNTEDLENKLIRHSMSNNIPSLKVAWNDMMGPAMIERAMKTGQQKQAEQKVKSKNLATASGSPAKVSSSVLKPGMTPNQQFNALMKDKRLDGY